MHAAGYCLDPQFHGHVSDLQRDPENQHILDELLGDGLFKMFRTILGSDEACSTAKQQWADYQTKSGAFSRLTPTDWDSAQNMAAWQWWNTHGSCAAALCKVAIRVLAQPSSSSACEQNWSAFDFIHSKRRNRLQPQRASDLVYVFRNLRALAANTISTPKQPFRSWEFDVGKGRGMQLEPSNEDSDDAEMAECEEEGGEGDDTSVTSRSECGDGSVSDYDELGGRSSSSVQSDSDGEVPSDALGGGEGATEADDDAGGDETGGDAAGGLRRGNRKRNPNTMLEGTYVTGPARRRKH